MRYHEAHPGAVLSITGDDHQDFLQGQGSADLRGPVGFCRYTLWLDYKGKILGDAHVLRRSESEMLLVSDATPAQFLMDKFDRHIIADDVEINDLTGQYTLVSLEPGPVPADLQKAGIECPVDGSYKIRDEHILFTGRRLGKGTLQILSTEFPLPSVEAELLSQSQCEALRIAAGMPLIPVDTDDQSLNPLEANITSPLSFTKGCYLGQEVVARVERLGRVSRRLIQVSAGLGQFEGPCPLHQDGQPVGKLTSVVNSGDKCLAVGWLKSRITDGNTVFDEGELQIESLPAS